MLPLRAPPANGILPEQARLKERARTLRTTKEAARSDFPGPGFYAAVRLDALLGKDLDRHLAAEPRVPRPVDLSHPARGERRENRAAARRGPASSDEQTFTGAQPVDGHQAR